MRFYKQLELRLLDLARLENGKLGTVDWREVDQAKDWDVELSRGLSENRAFLAVITPTYFQRANCGKDLWLFSSAAQGSA